MFSGRMKRVQWHEMSEGKYYISSLLINLEVL